jgi:hypothetical protein
VTQAEVPQVSLQRYVDLLKRRRWQVIPVSILGLLIGGIVAFFIPRYYVASTVLVHQMAPGSAAPTQPVPPLRSIVESARLTIPLAVGATIKKLGWEEAAASDPFELSENERAVALRLSVNDTNAQDKKRQFAQLVVAYRDRDGGRAASFLNTLVETWITQRLDDLRTEAEKGRATAHEITTRLDQTFNQLLVEKRHLEVEYAIEPGQDLMVTREAARLREAEQNRLREELVKQRAARAIAAQQLAKAQADLTATPRRVPQDAAELAEQAKKTPAGQVLVERIAYLRRSMENFHEGNPNRIGYELAAKELEQDLAALVGSAAADAEGMVPNPKHALLLAVIADAEARILALDATLGVLQQQVEDEDRRIARRGEGYEQYEKKLGQLDDARQQRDAARRDVERWTGILGKLGSQQTVKQVARANPPPRPTEPNILVVALIGCVLGLGIAIGLILLLDVLQGSFKTVEDVERGLPVPVLGGMSHLETEVERVTTRRSRRFAVAAAATFLTLATAVLVIFYVDPTVLPPMVRDLLVLVLGT